MDEEDLKSKAERSDRGLDSSINDEDLISESFNDDGVNIGAEQEGRIALTVWSTSTSKYTVTSTSTNTSTTLSLSYWCSMYGLDYPPTCA